MSPSIPNGIGTQKKSFNSVKCEELLPTKNMTMAARKEMIPTASKIDLFILKSPSKNEIRNQITAIPYLILIKSQSFLI